MGQREPGRKEPTGGEGEERGRLHRGEEGGTKMFLGRKNIKRENERRGSERGLGWRG